MAKETKTPKQEWFFKGQLATFDSIPAGSTLPYNQDPAKLKQWRKTLNISQKDLANEANVSQQLIGFIEAGERGFVEPTRSEIWHAIDRIAERKLNDPNDPWCKPAAMPMFPLLASDEEYERLDREFLVQRIKSQEQQIASLTALVAMHEKRNGWEDVNFDLYHKWQKQEEILKLLMELLNVETTKGLALKEAEALREEIAARFKRPGVSPEV